MHMDLVSRIMQLAALPMNQLQYVCGILHQLMVATQISQQNHLDHYC